MSAAAKLVRATVPFANPWTPREKAEVPKAEVPKGKVQGSRTKKAQEKAEGEGQDSAPKVKRYAIEIDGPERLAVYEKFEPAIKKFADAMRDAKRPLTMEECAGLLSAVSKTANPRKHCAWIFCRRLRPAGVLIESRG